jgi:hypothetical protein
LKEPEFNTFLGDAVLHPRFFSELVARMMMMEDVVVNVFRELKAFVKVMGSALSFFYGTRSMNMLSVDFDKATLLQFLHKALFTTRELRGKV